MPQTQKGKILRIHVSEHDQYDGKPLYEAVVAKCREMKIAGATVFKGLEGYGETAEIHRTHLIGHDQPILIAIVDSEAQMNRLIPVLDEMLDTGLMAVSDVDVIRVQTGSQSDQTEPDGS
jgi:PII-like signaling protein